MEFTKDEKEVLKNLINKQLKEIEQAEALPDQSFDSLGTEIKYDIFLSNILKKLE